MILAVSQPPTQETAPPPNKPDTNRTDGKPRQFSIIGIVKGHGFISPSDLQIEPTPNSENDTLPPVIFLYNYRG
jgi:hypothetical protein